MDQKSRWSIRWTFFYHRARFKVITHFSNFEMLHAGVASASNCVGRDIVQADHAPDNGVAQGIFHGILVRHHGRNQEEVEQELGEEVERQKEEDNTQTTTCTCMDGMM